MLGLELSSDDGGNLSWTCLAGLLQAGSTVLVLDNFTDTNGTALASHVIGPTNTPSTSWTALEGSILIEGNQAQCQSATSSAYLDSGQSNVTVSGNFTLGGANTNFGCQLIARLTDSNHYWLVEAYGGGSYYLYENVNGFTQRASGTWTPDTSQHTHTFSLSGTMVTYQIDSLAPISYGSASSNETATKCGIRGFVSGGNKDTHDNFQVTNP